MLLIVFQCAVNYGFSSTVAINKAGKQNWSFAIKFLTKKMLQNEVPYQIAYVYLLENII